MNVILHEIHLYEKRSIGKSTKGLTTLNPNLDALGKDMKIFNQTIHVIQVGCDNCSGTHLTKYSPLYEDGNKRP